MKSFAFVLVVMQAVLIRNAYTQVIKGSCGCPSPLISTPVYTTVAQPSIAASLADTLSLLTVSSLLAESLPLTPNVVAAIPVPVAIGDCGCGGFGYGGCGVCGCGGCGCGGHYGHGYSYIC